MQGIAQKILAAPERYSVDMLRRAVETGLLPAYVGIPLIQAKMQAQQQGQRFATLGQPSPDQQPTIAEQIMGQAGVDALPTNLPQEYAAGGIVAFSNGGSAQMELPGMDTRGTGPFGETVQERMARLRAAGLIPEVGSASRSAYVPKTPQELAAQARAVPQSSAAAAAPAASSAAAGATGATPSWWSRGLGALGRFATNPFVGGATLLLDSSEVGAGSDIVPGRPARPIPTPAEIDTLLKEGKISPQIADNMRQERARRDRANPPPAAADTDAAAQQRPPAGPRAGITALPAAAAAPVPAAPTLGRPSGPTNRDLAADAAANLRGLADMEEQYANQRMQDLRGQLTGKPFEAYKQRLENEARQAGADRADAKNVALIKAGLAMMAGTSRHALTNIGQGAMVGVADWQAAAKDFKTAERERSKELSLIEQAERAEQRGDVKEQMALLASARDRRLAQNSALTKMMLDASFADNQAEAARLVAQFNADAGIFKQQQLIAAEEREGDKNRGSRERIARIGATAREPRGKLGEAAYMKMVDAAMINPTVRNSALARLSRETGVPLKAAPKPTDPVYPQYEVALRRAAEQHVENLRPDGASAEAPAAPARPNFRVLGLE